MRTFLAMATVLLVPHTLEEVAWYLQGISPAGLPSTDTFVVVQVALYGLIALAFWKPSRFAYGIIGVILLYEAVHLLSAFRADAYTPGLATAVALLAFSIPYWTKLSRNNPQSP